MFFFINMKHYYVHNTQNTFTGSQNVTAFKKKNTVETQNHPHVQIQPVIKQSHCILLLMWPFRFPWSTDSVKDVKRRAHCSCRSAIFHLQCILFRQCEWVSAPAEHTLEKRWPRRWDYILPVSRKQVKSSRAA